MGRVNEIVPLGGHGEVDPQSSTAVANALEAAVAVGVDGYESTSGDDRVRDGDSSVSHLNEREDSEDEDNVVVAKVKTVDQVDQETLPEWKTWSVQRTVSIDTAGITETLISTIITVFSVIFGLCRGVKQTKPQPQDPKDIERYKRIQASRLKTHQNDTFKESHDALAEKIHEAGISSPAADCYRDHNYAVVQVIPIWLCCVIEKFRAYRTGLKQEPMFSKVYGQEVKYDSSRTLINCAKDGFLWFLISSMVTLAMAKHGFLMAVCSTSQRVARVVTYIESTGGSDSKVQAWHEDFCNAMAGYFQHEFGFSVLVSCLGGSIVDIVEGTYGQSVSKEFERENFRRIELKQGQALIMGCGLRHRGMAYDRRNVRLFLVYVVGKSIGASFASTYNIQMFKKKESVGKRKGDRNGSGKNKVAK